MKPTHYCLFLALAFLTACQSTDRSNTKKDTVPDPFETALPHGSSLPSTDLSPEDKQKLARASGRQVDSLSVDQLAQMIDSLDNGLHILNFWRIDCVECLQLNRQLSKIRQKKEASDFELHLLNLDELAALPEVNASIREQGLVDPCSILVQDSTLQWTALIKGNWEGSLPAMLLLNNSEGIRLFYRKNFSEEELETLIQPFTL